MSGASRRSDLRTIYHLLTAPRRAPDHASWLEAFYGRQAEGYDAFRARLLRGRRELLDALPLAPGQVVVDLGGGTGANLEFLDDARREALAAWYIVDLAPSLLAVARERIAAGGWRSVHAVEGDATAFVPPQGHADVVVFSYSLTMIPDWERALAHAEALLRPGGHVAVVDFTVAADRPAPGRARHAWLTRRFWPAWFSWDHVRLDPNHVDALERRFERVELVEALAPVPYLPGLRVPYYRFLGRRA